VAHVNLFGAERSIIARIQDQVPTLTTVASSSLIAGSKDITDLLPAAFVEPGPGSVGDGSGYGVAGIVQAWSVIVAVKHWLTARGDSSAAQLAGPYMLQVVTALDNWSPGELYDRMQWQGYADPISNAGFAAFEMSFTVNFSLPE
jgi:uncharacterized membrane protein YkvI